MLCCPGPQSARSLSFFPDQSSPREQPGTWLAQRVEGWLVLFRRRAQEVGHPSQLRGLEPATQERGLDTLSHTDSSCGPPSEEKGHISRMGTPGLGPCPLSKDTKPLRALVAPCTVLLSVLSHPHPILQQLPSQACSRCMVCVPASVSVSVPFCLDSS